MKSHGFIGIPILLLIVVAIAVLGSIGYFVIQGNSTTNSLTPQIDNLNQLVGVPGMPLDDTNNVTNSTTMNVAQAPTLIVDVCANIEGVQTTVPAGMILSGNICTTTPPVVNPILLTDVCLNIQGIQTTVPLSMTIQNGQCINSSLSVQNTYIPATPPTDPQLALNAQDRAEFRDKCITLSNFTGSSYAHYKDGYWASCVATQKSNISKKLQTGAFTKEWSQEAQAMLKL